MNSYRALAWTVHLVSLGVWLGAVLMAGVVAGILFPTMKSLDPALPAYAAYTGEHWLIAAGHVGRQMFLVADFVQLGCALLSVGSFASLVLWLGVPMRDPATLVRAFSLSTALACVAGQIFVLAPDMNGALARYWSAAAAGDMQAAAAHRDAFTTMHPTSTLLMSLTFVSVLLSMLVGAWWLGGRSGAVGADDAESTPRRPKGGGGGRGRKGEAPLETPRLAGNSR